MLFSPGKTQKKERSEFDFKRRPKECERTRKKGQFFAFPSSIRFFYFYRQWMNATDELAAVPLYNFLDLIFVCIGLWFWKEMLYYLSHCTVSLSCFLFAFTFVLFHRRSSFYYYFHILLEKAFSRLGILLSAVHLYLHLSNEKSTLDNRIQANGIILHVRTYFFIPVLLWCSSLSL